MVIKKAPKAKRHVHINYEIDNNFDELISDSIAEFNKKIQPEKRNMDYYFYNVNRLKCEVVNENNTVNEFALAEFNVLNNLIRYVKKYYKYGIMHELLHMASRVRTKNRVYFGFAQIDLEEKENIGIGLTEGYTCLLDERYFKDTVKDKQEVLGNTYSITKYFVFLLEQLVTKEVMEEMYFKADLHGLITWLSKFITREEAVCLIQALDNIFYYCDSKKIPNIIVTKQNYEYAIYIIGKCFLNMFALEYSNGEIDDHIYKLYQDMIWREMNKKLRFKGLKFNVTSGISKKEFEYLNEQARKLTKKNT